MNVLNLVTSADAEFFVQQVDELERRGVAQRTVDVPCSLTDSDRSVLDYARFYPRVLRAARRDADLVHANYGLTAPAALAQPRRPVVLSLWGSDLYGDFGRLSRLCSRACDEVVVMSPAMAAELDRDCHVVPHGVDTDVFAPSSRTAACRELGWDPDRAHVLFPYGPEMTVKDYPRARRVVAAVRDRVDRPVTLQTVTGEPHDRVPVYMNAADALLLTSRWEGSPNSVKEAMACGLPVVSVDVGDVAERLADVHPSVVAAEDATLTEGLARVLRLGERSNGPAVVESVSLETMGDRLLEVYRSALDDR